MDVTIELLTEEDVHGFATAMARAFENYPVMRRAFADYPENRKEWIYRLSLGSITSKVRAGCSLPVAKLGDRVIGGASVLLPGFKTPPGQEAWFEDFLEQAGPTTKDFFPRFIGAVDSIALPDPHTHLIMIGVEPEFQGKGIGRKLIEKVVDLSAEVPQCEGIALDTEQPGNVDIYRACGFEVLGETSVDDLPIWVMWRTLR